jgi:sugar phosphate isomerase/epimerase
MHTLQAGVTTMWPLAICNEMWKGEPIEQVFAKAKRMGYDGVEIAPFTLGESADQVPASRRKEIVRAAADSGVRMPALHWLFVGPAGIHLTSPEQAVRRAAADYLRVLIDLCADLGGSILVHGSPKQRSFAAPDTFQDAWNRALEVVSSVVPHLKARKVTWCCEALSPLETNFINMAEQAVQFAEAIHEPDAVGIMLDVKAMSFMPGGPEQNLARFGRFARHLHVNTPDGKGPGMAPYEFGPVLRAAKQAGFKGWVSAEPFDYMPDPDTVARTILETLQDSIHTMS